MLNACVSRLGLFQFQWSNLLLTKFANFPIKIEINSRGLGINVYNFEIIVKVCIEWYTIPTVLNRLNNYQMA